MRHLKPRSLREGLYVMPMLYDAEAGGALRATVRIELEGEAGTVGLDGAKRVVRVRFR